MTQTQMPVPRSRLVRFLVARRRLLASLTAGLVLLALLPTSLLTSTRWLLAWDLVMALYVAGAFWVIGRSTVETCQHRAALYDESDGVIVLIVVASAAASLAAIFTKLGHIKGVVGGPPVLEFAVAVLTVVLAWTFTHTTFTLHYANLYYRPAKTGVSGGLRFPGTSAPDYRDFLYYAFVIGCAAQTADVATESTTMRLVSLVHGIVAFVFNTAILALIVNVGAGLLA